MGAIFFNPEIYRSTKPKISRPLHCRFDELLVSISTMRHHLDRLEDEAKTLQNNMQAGRAFMPEELKRRSRHISEGEVIIRSIVGRMFDGKETDDEENAATKSHTGKVNER